MEASLFNTQVIVATAKSFMKAYNREKFKEQRPKYQKLCVLLPKQLNEDGLQMSNDEIRKSANRVMVYGRFSNKGE